MSRASTKLECALYPAPNLLISLRVPKLARAFRKLALNSTTCGRMNWAETILESLQERDRMEGAHHELIVHSHHLVQLARVLKEHNAALMHATTTTGHASVTKQGKTTSQVE